MTSELSFLIKNSKKHYSSKVLPDLVIVSALGLFIFKFWLNCRRLCRQIAILAELVDFIKAQNFIWKDYWPKLRGEKEWNLCTFTNKIKIFGRNRNLLRNCATADCRLHWTEEGVKMENQNAPLVIRLSRTPKTNPRNNFCFKSLSTMGAKLVVFQHITV